MHFNCSKYFNFLKLLQYLIFYFSLYFVFSLLNSLPHSTIFVLREPEKIVGNLYTFPQIFTKVLKDLFNSSISFSFDVSLNWPQTNSCTQLVCRAGDTEKWVSLFCWFGYTVGYIFLNGL